MHDIIVFGAGMAVGHFAWTTVVKIYAWIEAKFTKHV